MHALVMRAGKSSYVTLAPERIARPPKAPRSLGAPTVSDRAPDLSPTPDVLAHDVCSGIWVGLRAFGAQYILLLLAMLTTVLATPYSLSGTPWNDSSKAAALLLLLGHGAQPKLTDTRISVVPLGLICLAVIGLFIAARRSAINTRAGFTAGVASYTAAITGTALAAHIGIVGIATAVFGGAAVSALGIGLAMAKIHVLDRVNPLHGRLPEEGIIGLKVGAMAIFSILGASALLVGYWAVESRASQAAAVAILAPGTVGIVMLAVGQLTVLPNMVAWISAWLIGPGFSLGQGTKYSTGELVTGPLPQLPMLGALPPGAWSGVGMRGLAVIVVMIGMCGGFLARRKLKATTLRSALLVMGTAGTTFGLGIAGLQWLAGGRLGSGRFAQIGANPWRVGGLGAIEIAGGVGMVFLGMYAWVRRDDIRDAITQLGSRFRPQREG